MTRTTQTDLAEADWEALAPGQYLSDSVVRGLTVYRNRWSNCELKWRWQGTLGGKTPGQRAKRTSRELGRVADTTLEEAREAACLWKAKSRMDRGLSQGLPLLCPSCLASLREAMEVETLIQEIRRENR